MIQHLLKLIWNRKRSNALMILEIFFSFLVLFAISTLFIYNLNNYMKPLGFSYDNVWSLTLREVATEATNVGSEADQSKTPGKYESILNQLKMYNQIEAFSASGANVPYSFNTHNTNVGFDNKNTMSFIYYNDDQYPDVVGLKLVEGRWFNSSDDASRLPPVVINDMLVKELLDGESPLGKVINIDGEDQVIVGIVGDYRSKGEFSATASALFKRINKKESGLRFDNVIIKVKPGIGAAFEEQLIKDLGNIVPGWTLEISALEKMRETQHKITKVPMIALLVICGFLIINVALGLFGVLWYNINRRYSEIGLRRAMGATAGKIQLQFIGEVLVLATFGVLLGAFIAFQFPLLKVFNTAGSVYFSAILISVFLIYTLAIICAWYPGREAAKIEPAVALHDE